MRELEFGVRSGKTRHEIARSRKGVDVFDLDSGPARALARGLPGGNLRRRNAAPRPAGGEGRFGEYRAWGEHIDATGWKFSCEAVTIDNEQVVVQLTDVGSHVDIERFAPAPRAAVQHR